ncbi:EAL domain-containing protein [Pseudomonas baetica]|uniref:EAL domain-containing protein n=1 Tax=Pseudomonas baetica TaxID=674054 RepID=UPI003EEE4B3E
MSYSILVLEGGGLKKKFLHALQVNMEGVVLRAAKNSHEAFELFNAYSFDMVLSSLTMLEVSGAQLFRKGVDCRPLPALAILDDSPRQTAVNACLAARNFGFTVVGLVSKPLDVIDLRALHGRLMGLSAGDPEENPVPHHPHALLDHQHKYPVQIGFQVRKNLRSGRITAVKAQALQHHLQSNAQSLLPANAGSEVEEAFLVHVVSQVISAQRAWREQGCRVIVWIQLFMSVLRRSGFAERMHQFVVSREGEPECIGFELARTSKKENLTHHLGSIYKLRLKGFAVAHDDVGQGYRYCLNLKLTPFTDVKIFPPLVRSAVKNEKLASSLACIITESQQLGLTVLAEGVSTQEEWALLQRLNCDEAQGPLVSETMQQDELARLLVKNRRECI